MFLGKEAIVIEAGGTMGNKHASPRAMVHPDAGIQGAGTDTGSRVESSSGASPGLGYDWLTMANKPEMAIPASFVFAGNIHLPLLLLAAVQLLAGLKGEPQDTAGRVSSVSDRISVSACDAQMVMGWYEASTTRGFPKLTVRGHSFCRITSIEPIQRAAKARVQPSRLPQHEVGVCMRLRLVRFWPISEAKNIDRRYGGFKSVAVKAAQAVSRETTVSAVVCECNHFSTFGATLKPLFTVPQAHSTTRGLHAETSELLSVTGFIFFTFLCAYISYHVLLGINPNKKVRWLAY
ncbi:unnamed protein product [Schistocephalus solidus]|uniref:Dolichyl-diphosphooligosaccharide--protein glycosyltransferase 48 kDa subunit n=1 Tax=Schistocephalus solidus TaxID=70667 RepID=A0A183TL05_SCHSO|nr:unnamed protein product [Schistocephalus solidus]